MSDEKRVKAYYDALGGKRQQQSGRGLEDHNVYRGPAIAFPRYSRQYGGGFFSALGGFFRRVIPRYGPVFLRAATSFGSKLLADHDNKINFEDSVKQRVKQTGLDLAKAVVNQAEADQTGGGCGCLPTSGGGKKSKMTTAGGGVKNKSIKVEKKGKKRKLPAPKKPSKSTKKLRSWKF